MGTDPNGTLFQKMVPLGSVPIGIREARSSGDYTPKNYCFDSSVSSCRIYSVGLTP